MKKVKLNVQEEVKRLLPETLEKNLTEHEMICPVCHGLGIIKRNQPYGLKPKNGKMNWYDNEYFIWCPHCYFGVVKLCEFCGKPLLMKGSNRCNCEGFKRQEEEELRIKSQKAVERATEVENIQGIECFYDEKLQQYFYEIEDFVEEYKELYYDFVEEYNGDFDKFFKGHVPKILWTCSETRISMDAYSIIESECEELHEDAFYNIGDKDIKELQNYLDGWCKNQTGTTTYYPDYEKYIRVKKEWFDD